MYGACFGKGQAPAAAQLPPRARTATLGEWKKKQKLLGKST